MEFLVLQHHPQFPQFITPPVIARTVGNLENMEKIWRKYGENIMELPWQDCSIFFWLLNTATTCYNERIHDVPPKKNHGTHATIDAKAGKFRVWRVNYLWLRTTFWKSLENPFPERSCWGISQRRGQIFVEILEENWKSSLMSFLRSLIQMNFSQKAVWSCLI